MQAVRISDDGQHAAAIERDAGAGVRLWSLQRLGLAYRSQTLGDEKSYLYALAFDPENRLVTTDNRGQVQAWNVSSAIETSCPGNTTPGKELELCIEPTDGRGPRLVGAGGEGVSIRSVGAGDGLLVLATADHVPRILDLAETSFEKLTDPRLKLKHTKGRWAASLRPNNPQLKSRLDVATGDAAGRLILWDVERVSDRLKTRAATALDLGSKAIEELAFHPQGRWLAAVTVDGWLHLVDLGAETDGGGAAEPGVLAATKVASGRANAVDFDPVGKHLAVAGTGLSWWHFDDDADSPLTSHEDPKEHPVPGAVGPFEAIACIPGDAGTVATTAAGSVLLWTLEEQGWPVELHGEGSWLVSLVGSDDGRFMAAVAGDGRFMVWDIKVERYVCRLALRNLTADEGKRNAGGIEHQEICQGLPTDAELAR